MLVITREAEEEIKIGPDIMVKFFGIDESGEAIIGIDAPRSLKIRRVERNKKHLENADGNR